MKHFQLWSVSISSQFSCLCTCFELRPCFGFPSSFGLHSVFRQTDCNETHLMNQCLLRRSLKCAGILCLCYLSGLCFLTFKVNFISTSFSSTTADFRSPVISIVFSFVFSRLTDPFGQLRFAFRHLMYCVYDELSMFASTDCELYILATVFLWLSNYYACHVKMFSQCLFWQKFFHIKEVAFLLLMLNIGSQMLCFFFYFSRDYTQQTYCA